MESERSGRKRGRPRLGSARVCTAPPPEKQKKAIATMFAQNWPQMKIVQQTGVSIRHVRQVMAAKGLKFADRHPGRRFPGVKVTDAQKQLMAKLFDQGHTHASIAQRLNLSTLAVGRVLRSLGKRRGPSRITKKMNTVDRGKLQQVATTEAESRQSPEIEERTAVSTSSACPGKKRRSSHWKVTESHKRTIAAMFDRGDSVNRIHEKVHLAHSTVQRVLGILGKNYRRRGKVPKQAPRAQPAMSDADYRQSPEIPETKLTFRSSSETAETCANRTNDQVSVGSAAETHKMMVNCHASVFRCETCQFDTSVLEPFISHLLSSEHPRVNKNVLLVCVGCRFQSRQPLKMVGHAIKHQTNMETRGEKKGAD